MSEQKDVSITDLKSEYDFLRQKYELDYDLARLKISMEEELLERKRRALEEQRRNLLELDFDELIQKLEFQNNQLRKNLVLVENEKKENNTLKAKISLWISLIVGILSLIFAFLPFVERFSTLPDILISLCLILLFVAGIWIYNSWNRLKLKRDKEHILTQKIIEAGELHKYISNIIENYNRRFELKP